MKKIVLSLIAMVALAGGAWGAGCCDPASDCCGRACCKRVVSK
jgi:hypothetical protein